MAMYPHAVVVTSKVPYILIEVAKILRSSLMDGWNDERTDRRTETVASARMIFLEIRNEMI